eukprot:CAMPEP_0182419384 /NCGR_PEP_ID=MMETSP1167-20130531/3850_1 /TAXON_ID=2988 /ORGANISM="Mallomonas Sp, Strain CCMP3275" /LENGTH=616 /DNA_ID=CAMNT_0024594285 /DNA_START=202 /DNA_END=2052 /DNA_ORIENTATION=-
MKPTHGYPTTWPTPAVGSSTHECDESSNRNYAYTVEVDTKFLPGIKIVYIEDLKFITITYGPPVKTYTILLYHCTYPDRAALHALGYHDVYFIYQIPFMTVGYTRTYFSHALELLNLRSAATVSATPLMWNTSPCFIQLYSNGYIINAFDNDAREMHHILEENDVDATFASEHEVRMDMFRSVPVPFRWYNSTALEEAESLLMFIGVFFNAEEAVNEVVDHIRSSYECTATIAKKAEYNKEFRGRSVLWCDHAGKHSVYTKPKAPDDPHADDGTKRIENIWRCPSCPSVECSLVTDSGARYLDIRDFGISTLYVNGTAYISTSEFMEMAVYADYWITTGDPYSDFNKTLVKLLAEDKTNKNSGILPLEMIPAVQYHRVYDWKKKGVWNAIQMGPLEPDSMLQDIASLIRQLNHDRIWLRNIWTEKIVFELGSCVGNPWGAQALHSTTCIYLTGNADSSYKHRISGLSADTREEDARSMIYQVGMGFLLLGAFGLVASFIYHVMMNKNQASINAVRALGKDAKKMNTTTTGSKKYSRKKSLIVSSALSSDSNDGSLSYERTAAESYHGDIDDSSISCSETMTPNTKRSFIGALPNLRQQIPVVMADTRLTRPWSTSS